MTTAPHFDSPAAQRISAEGSSKVQLQRVLHSGPSVNFHFTGADALAQRNQAKEMLQHLLPQFSLQVVYIHSLVSRLRPAVSVRESLGIMCNIEELGKSQCCSQALSCVWKEELNLGTWLGRNLEVVY